MLVSLQTSPHISRTPFKRGLAREPSCVVRGHYCKYPSNEHPVREDQCQEENRVIWKVLSVSLDAHSSNQTVKRLNDIPNAMQEVLIGPLPRRPLSVCKVNQLEALYRWELDPAVFILFHSTVAI